jgi:hypothetical protein
MQRREIPLARLAAKKVPPKRLRIQTPPFARPPGASHFALSGNYD